MSTPEETGGVAFTDPVVHVFSDLTELQNRRADWTALAHESLEPNVFYEPFFLQPSVAHLTGGEPLRFVTIDVMDHQRGHRVLCGVFPFRLKRHYGGFPVRILTLWRHRYCFLATPLIRQSCAALCLGALCQWHAEGPFRDALLEFADIHGGGPFLGELLAAVDRAHHVAVTTSTHQRPLLQPVRSADEYESAAISVRRRREYRRQLKRLRERGSVAFSSLERGQDPLPWLRAFLELERSGWKGRRGSAFLSRGHGPFFEEMAGGAWARDQLAMAQLTVDSQPVAMSCHLISGRALFAFKIAYDEAFAAYSPGVQLQLYNLRRIHDGHHFDCADSCGRPVNIFTGLWNDRREIRTVLVGSRQWSSRVVAASAAGWSRLRSTMRRTE